MQLVLDDTPHFGANCVFLRISTSRPCAMEMIERRGGSYDGRQEVERRKEVFEVEKVAERVEYVNVSKYSI